MKHVIELLLSIIGQTALNWLKVEVLKIYISIVNGARSIVIVLSLLFFMLIVLIGGFIGIHVALFYVLPFEDDIKAFILLGLSAFYFGGAIIAIMILTAKRRWNRMCGLEALAARWARSIYKNE